MLEGHAKFGTGQCHGWMWSLALLVLVFLPRSVSFSLNLTIFLTRPAGIPFSIGSWMVPLEVLELLISSLKAPIAEAFGYQCGCRRALALVSSYHGGRSGSVA